LLPNCWRLLKGDTITRDEIDELADVFLVSPYVIEHQVCNHRLASVV